MKPTATYQKLRGGYYTPRPIADFLARWAIQAPTARVLEPSCGDGVFLQAAAETLLEQGATTTEISDLIYGVEYDPQEAAKALEYLHTLCGHLSTTQVHVGDFFAYCHTNLSNKHHFDAIVGNPPFVRYQNFPEEQRRIAFYLMQQAGLHPKVDKLLGPVSRLSNAPAQWNRSPGDGYPRRTPPSQLCSRITLFLESILRLYYPCYL